MRDGGCEKTQKNNNHTYNVIAENCLFALLLSHHGSCDIHHVYHNEEGNGILCNFGQLQGKLMCKSIHFVRVI